MYYFFMLLTKKSSESFNRSYSANPFKPLFRRFLSVMLLFVILLSFVGCQKNIKAVEDDYDAEESLSEIMDIELTSLPKWIAGDYPRILVLFGYGYTEDENRLPVEQKLFEEFGKAEDKGLIYTAVFPDEYVKGGRIHLDFISRLVEDKNLCGLIIVGAPERTHYALSDMQDSGYSFPVFSIFSQDDVLGIESGSTFVLDYKGIPSDKSSIHQEEYSEFSGNMSEILLPVIRLIRDTSKGKSLLPSAAAVAMSLETAYKKYIPECSVRSFVDPESGLRALNHYVLEVYE